MVEMKRFRFKGKEETNSINMADILVLLSRGGEEINHKHAFECKTCNKQFASFQALGGHRASHKKPRLSDNNQGAQTQGEDGKPKVHECSICGLEFTIGQALGGHMRRHRTANGVVENKSNRQRVLLLDLNLPALGEDNGCGQELGLG